MARYAETTTVPVSRSRDEIYRLLERYGADQRLFGDDATRIGILFRLKGRNVKVERTLPHRWLFSSQAAYDREIRRIWRVMVLILKGRLELVSEGEETVDQAFAAYLALPDGSTVGDHITERMDHAYATGEMPESILPGLAPVAKVIALGSGGR